MEVVSGARGLSAAEEIHKGSTAASAFLLHAIEQVTGPSEINSQQGKAKQNHKPAGTGTDEQDNPEQQECEACCNAKHPASLLKRFEDKNRHSVLPF